MKLFGSLKELVSIVFRDDSQEITLRPNQSTTYTASRDIQLPPGDAAHVLTSADSTQTLTNKTISGASNTLSNVNLASQVTGTLPIANGGTGQTSQTAAFDGLAPTTTKGDLIVNDGTDNVRLAVGTDGFGLVADSAQTAGVKWAAVLTNPMDSAGDLIYGGASGVATKLDSGTSGQLLISQGAAAPAWTDTITRAKLINEASDTIQLQIRGHSTQTSDILVVEKSDGTDLLQVTNVNGTKIRGTTTNDSAASTDVGFANNQSRTFANKTALTTATPINVTATQLSLTAGDYIISGYIGFNPGAGTSITVLEGAISLTSATIPSSAALAVPTSGEVRIQQSSAAQVPGSGNQMTITLPKYRISVASSTAVYLVAQAIFTVSTLDVYGFIEATRVR